MGHVAAPVAQCLGPNPHLRVLPLLNPSGSYDKGVGNAGAFLAPCTKEAVYGYMATDGDAEFSEVTLAFFRVGRVSVCT